MIREATYDDAARVARVHVESWRAAYRGLVSSDYLDSLSYEDGVRRWTRILDPAAPSGFTYVLEDGGGSVVGFASAGPSREGELVYRGELYSIYLLPEHWGRGHGRALVGVVAARLLRLNLDSMLVWVFAENRAARFYEALGAREIGEGVWEREEMRLRTLCYGWRDIRPLASGD